MAAAKKKATKKKATKKATGKRGPYRRGTHAEPIPQPAEAPGQRGRPTYKPTKKDRETVKSLAGFGLHQKQIADIMINPETGAPISLKTLKKHYNLELLQGAPTAISKVAQSLYQKAIGNGPASVTAAIFFLKARAGWSEKVELGVPGNTGVLVVPAAMTPEQWCETQRKKNADRQDPSAE